MKIAHLSDLHLTNRKDDSGETLDEQVQRLGWIAGHALENKVGLVVVAGDTFHARSNADERNAAIRVYTGLAGVAPVVVVKGNNTHDGPGEIDFLANIRTSNKIYAVSRPCCSEPRLKNDLGCLILAMPYPEKHWLAATASESGMSATQLSQGAIKTLFLDWAVRRNKAHDLPAIMVGHLELGTATLDSGQPAIGKCFVELGESDLLEIGADFYALGHIHQHQILGDGRICYAGSPRQTTFGEDAKKGYCLVDVEPGEMPVIEHITAPGPKLITVEGGWVTDLERLTTEEDENDHTWWIPPQGCDHIMRLQYSVFDSNRVAAAEQAEQLKKLWLEAGARSVKIDAKVIATTRTRTDELRTARTNEDRLRALWGSRDETPDRADAITTKLDELEVEVANG